MNIMLKTTADAVIKSMYEAINRRDITAAMEFIDDNCLYQDLNFPQPFQGKEEVQQLLEESCKGIPDDLLFVIDDISTGDDLAVGVLWHVELDGIPFPNGRGVSFYRLSATTGKLELNKLEKNLSALATISGAAPMIGFLGTVIGMILSIFEIANSGGQIDIKLLADGLYTAMTTTVGGLIVGIVGYIAYNHLVVRTNKVVYQMEANSVEFLDHLNEPM